MDKSASRKRGIKASRQKLEKAMHNAGVKTQASLAERIAELEGTPSVPKDMVNRAFRQVAVEPKSLERIAKALNVDAYTLYLSTEEPETTNEVTAPQAKPVANTSSQPVGSSSMTKWVMLLSMGVVVLFLISIFWADVASHDSFVSGDAKSWQEPVLDKYSLLMRSTSAQGQNLAAEFATSIEGEITVATLFFSPEHANTPSAELAREYQADGVVTLNFRQHARYVVTEVLLYINGVEQIVEYSVTPAFELASYPQTWVKETRRLLKAALNQREVKPVQPVQIEAWQHYLDAKRLIDKQDFIAHSAEINLLLLQATNKRPDFTRGFAALCQAQALRSWIKDEKTALEDAKRACEKALLLNPDDVTARTYHAELNIYIGNADTAVSALSSIVEEYPANAEAWNVLGRAYQEAYTQEVAIDDVFEKGNHSFDKAIEIEPDYWYHRDAKARYLFVQGKIKEALPYSKSAALMSQNSVAMVNVGVLSMCTENLQQANEMFTTVREIAPHSHLGEEYAGLLAFYQHDFDQAVDLISIAIEKLGGDEDATIHQYWGSLGDSERLRGNTEQAIAAYQSAVRSVQFYKLRGVGGAWEDVAEVYYLMQMALLQQQTPEISDAQEQRLQEILAQDNSLGVKVRLAQVLKLKGDAEQATSLWTAAGEGCWIYSQHPDFLDGV